MLEKIYRILTNDKIRYLIGGGMTTAVNIVVFFLLRTITSLNRNTCNVIAIMLAITFAYFINKFYVFRSRTKGVSQLLTELLSFVGMRLISMGVEVLGFAILCDTFRFPELASKLCVQLIVIIANYMFSKLFVFNKKRRSIEEHIRDNYCYYIAMGIVFVVYVSVCIAMRCMPFGPNSVTLVDSIHQYVPYISEFRDKLLHEGSLFYSWNIGMGINFSALSAYYLASPFNFLFLLVDKFHIPAMYACITAIKLMISAATMVHLLSYKDGIKRRNPVIIAFGVAYALSNYMIGYGWNIMWLDCIMVLPLIVLGFHRLMKQGNPILYTLSMFYCLYCNYYIGFMICIFMVLWFFVYRHRGIRQLFMHGIRFAWYSLLSGCMAAFSLLPAYFGIMATSAGKMKLPPLAWYGSIFNMLRQMFVLTKPITNQTFDGNVNLYCGMFAVFACFLYMFGRGISLYDKVTKLLLLTFMMVSFNAENLNYIWHGMHNQYGIPNRFSFLFIFVLLVMAYDVIRNIRKMKPVAIIGAGILTDVLLYLCRVKSDGGMEGRVVTVSAVLIVVYTVWCLFAAGRNISGRILRPLFAGMMCLELLVSAVFGYNHVGYAGYSATYENAMNVTEAYHTVEELAQESKAGFYRAELMDSAVLDEASWHNMPSISIFGSTVAGELVSTMGRLGFYTGANEFLYMGATPFTNSIFNVQYLLHRPEELNNFDFNYVTTVADVDIYENPYPLSLGFCVDDKVEEWDRNSNLPLDAQNSLIYHMNGGVSIFQPMVPDMVTSGENCTTTTIGSTINFTPNETGTVKVFATFHIYRDGDYYINCRGNNINKIAFHINGEQIAYDRYQIQIFHLGKLRVGDSVTVEYQLNSMEPTPHTVSLHLATFDAVAYRSVYEDLKTNMLEVSEVSDGYVKGTVNVPAGKLLFTSIPYDAGWKVYVDGTQTEITQIGNAFIGVKMTPGIHEITFRYTPRGFWPGFIITVVSWTLFLFGRVSKIRRRKEKIGDNDIDRTVNV
ncbi:MAG: GtrA family protein [Eubacteriales bacterium]|nr:GtrA family protein [Eubacteriales bacterium]